MVANLLLVDGGFHNGAFARRLPVLLSVVGLDVSDALGVNLNTRHIKHR